MNYERTFILNLIINTNVRHFAMLSFPASQTCTCTGDWDDFFFNNEASEALITKPQHSSLDLKRSTTKWNNLIHTSDHARLSILQFKYSNHQKLSIIVLISHQYPTFLSYLDFSNNYLSVVWFWVRFFCNTGTCNMATTVSTITKPWRDNFKNFSAFDSSGLGTISRGRWPTSQPQAWWTSVGKIENRWIAAEITVLSFLPPKWSCCQYMLVQPRILLPKIQIKLILVLITLATHMLMT